ncbi:right-handed parallel beta-helix repeat-containing protein, partial [Dehalococcoidia bacterium]|nr:right-handed parallel beta-helix repeat-containing protein [Dehalococcoidia bacterium]
MKLLEWLCNKANLSILKPRNPTKKVRSLIVVACCIALLAMLGCPVAEPEIQFVPNGDGVFTIGHIAHAPAADFVADGVDDHIQFQQALDALPTGGGKLIVLAGTYNFGAAVGRAIDNVTIQGIGQATVINRDGINPVFTAGAQSNWVFRDFKTDAGGIELTAAKNYTLQNITIGISYVAFRTDAAAEAWDIPIGRTATLVVAASDSSPQSKAQADFVADGVDDQVEIQAAIDALPAGGGKVLLMEGTYNIVPDRMVAAILTAISLYFRENVTLEGQGRGTILRTPTITDQHFVAILAVNAPRTTIRGLTIDLNSSGSFATQIVAQGISLIESLTTDTIVTENKVFGGAYSENISLWRACYNAITNNILLDGADGVGLTEANGNLISNNLMRNAVTEAVDLIESGNNIIVGNVSEGNSHGVLIRGATSRGNVIKGNVIINSKSCGIRTIAGTGNLIEGNVLIASAGTGMGIHTSGNIIANNYIERSGAYGIMLISANHNIIANNIVKSSSQKA